MIILVALFASMQPPIDHQCQVCDLTTLTARIDHALTIADESTAIHSNKQLVKNLYSWRKTTILLMALLLSIHCPF